MNTALAQSEITWKEALEGEKGKPYFKALLEFIEGEKRKGKTIYPPKNDIFNAIQLTRFSEVKVVVLGQDPYHGPNQAHGLAFSVQPGIPTPPSLQNIYKEINSDLGLPIPKTGYLASWAEQGVLLLNAVLTVEAANANAHANKGWEQFTDRVILELAERREHLVFMLWGSYAQKKAAAVDSTRHLILKAPHPSPLSAHRGFLGSKPFSKANEYLIAQGILPIDWSIPGK